MPFNRANSCVAIGLFVLFAATSARGQELQGFQLFAPADVSTFGGDQEPNEGYFFQFDGLFWSISAPRTVPIGAPGLTRLVYYGPFAYTTPYPPPSTILPPIKYQDQRLESNTLDTGDIKSAFSPGTRFEFGHIEDNNGWLASIYRVQPLEQDFLYPSADVVFKDPPQGPLGQGLLTGPIPLDPASYSSGGAVIQVPLPVTLYNLAVSDTVDTWSVELMYLHRFRTCHVGGTLEFFGGVRYLEFNDSFNVQAGPDPGGHVIPSFLQNSYLVHFRREPHRGPASRPALVQEGGTLDVLDRKSVHGRFEHAEFSSGCQHWPEPQSRRQFGKSADDGQHDLYARHIGVGVGQP